MDGSTSTAWVLSQAPPIGQWWEVQLDRPTTVDSINLSQLVTNRPTQVLTKLTLTFDYAKPVVVNLTHASQTAAGQTIHFSPRTFSLLRITMNASHGTKYQVPAGYQNVTGLSEVRIPGVRTSEFVSMPQDLLRAAGPSSLSDPLDLLMTRLRSSGFPPRARLRVDAGPTVLAPDGTDVHADRTGTGVRPGQRPVGGRHGRRRGVRTPARSWPSRRAAGWPAMSPPERKPPSTDRRPPRGRARSRPPTRTGSGSSTRRPRRSPSTRSTWP